MGARSPVRDERYGPVSLPSPGKDTVPCRFRSAESRADPGHSEKALGNVDPVDPAARPFRQPPRAPKPQLLMYAADISAANRVVLRYATDKCVVNVCYRYMRCQYSRLPSPLRPVGAAATRRRGLPPSPPPLAAHAALAACRSQAGSRIRANENARRTRPWTAAPRLPLSP